MNYYLHILLMVEIYSILVLSLNMQLGFSGLPNFAIGIFYGLGAYSYALVSIHFGLSFFPAMVIAFAVNMLMSLIISFASMRFKEEIFVLVSIAFQIIVYSILWNWDSLTGGANGISNIPKPQFFGLEISSITGFTILGGLLLILVIILFKIIQKSNFGNVLLAIKDNEMSAKSIGINANYFKVINIAISCGVASISGVLFASYIGYIDTESFGIHESIDVIFILVLSGLLSVRGVLIGTALFFVIQEVFKYIGFSNDIAFNMRIILFSIIILLIIYFKPKGLFGKYKIS